jgi:hypothetical protein
MRLHVKEQMGLFVFFVYITFIGLLTIVAQHYRTWIWLAFDAHTGKGIKKNNRLERALLMIKNPS